MSVQNIIFVGKVFQIEILDHVIHPLGSRQNVNLCPAMVINGVQVFRRFYVFRVQKDHSLSVQNSMFIGEVFQI